MQPPFFYILCNVIFISFCSQCARKRDATSVLIAQRFFPTATAVGFAADTDAAGAITAGTLLAKMGGPLLFVPSGDGLPDRVRTYLTTLMGRVTSSFVFGGSSNISDGQLAAIQGAL